MKTKTKTMKPTTNTKPSGGTRPEEMTTKQVRDLIHAEARKCAEKWFPLQCRRDWASFYLYYRTGELDVSDAENAPEGWTLASAERLNPGDTRAQVAAKIATIAQRLPFLPV